MSVGVAYEPTATQLKSHTHHIQGGYENRVAKTQQVIFLGYVSASETASNAWGQGPNDSHIAATPVAISFSGHSRKKCNVITVACRRAIRYRTGSASFLAEIPGFGHPENCSKFSI